MSPTPDVDAVTAGVKAATAIDHIKNNRIEYLLLLIVSHFLGLTDILISKASGVC